jgi:hypothetical protein
LGVIAIEPVLIAGDEVYFLSSLEGECAEAIKLNFIEPAVTRKLPNQ